MNQKKKPKWKKEYPNLIPIDERDEEEALELRKKGGEAQTQKKTNIKTNTRTKKSRTW